MKLSSRKELIKEAELELEKIRELTFKKPKMTRGGQYDRWGDLIYDPDISEIDYEELKRKDPTLPKKDPRGWKIFWDETLWRFPQYMKWLYFSDELGSYANREKLYLGAYGENARKQLMKKLDPTLLTQKQKQQSSPLFNTPELKKQMPKTFIELVSDKKKWNVVVRYFLASILDAMNKD